MIEPVVAIHSKQLNLQGLNARGNTLATVTILDAEDLRELRRADGSAAQAGDVYSPQPDGTLQTRVKGTADAYEVGLIVGASFVWAPQGSSGPAFIAPYVADLPNV